ncbi:MAG: oligopeptide transporter, OPT family [Planctomycetes bacterium]|nr:oligopeptide transporter, OPT family [Planctomycetota bacterium]
MSDEAKAFEPAVAASESPPELTFRAVALGALLGIVFGAASTYLALRVGLTTSASVPIAVLAIWAIRKRKDQRAILEHNIVQTTGSAGESVAGALAFTVPALIFLGFPLQVGLTTLIALTGGMLGVLMMVPLRRYLIVKEHGTLRYPEGKACAEILAVGERGGTSARKVFVGLGVGALFKAVQTLFGALPGTFVRVVPGFRGAAVGCDYAPELLGVGYIIGYRTSTMMVAGSLLASFVLIPVIVLFGSSAASPIAPATDLISAMDADSVWGNYVRHIGAGAVAAGGIFALVRALPAIGSSLSASMRGLGGSGASAAAPLRTDRDTPVPVLAFGAIAIVALIWLVPVFHMNSLGALLILVLGFLFSVVSSRITGEVGSSSCPLSGMTIGVLMATCGVFLLVGWEGDTYARLALTVGAIVCVAISNAGTCSQDLKTGYLVGATPVRQQGALLIGVLTSVLAVGWTAYLLNYAKTTETVLNEPFQVRAELVVAAESVSAKTDGVEYRYVRLPAAELPVGVVAGTYLVDPATNQARFLRLDGIGQGELRAPQSRLMATVIDGLLTRRLPWDLILLGVAIAIFIELLGFNSLTFAVGVYLPLAATLPVFLGGVARKLADRVYRRTPDAEEESEGTLFSSGLLAGASILGIVGAALNFLPGYDSDAGLHPAIAFLAPWRATWSADVQAAALIGTLGLVAFLIFRAAAPNRNA